MKIIYTINEEVRIIRIIYTINVEVPIIYTINVRCSSGWKK